VITTVISIYLSLLLKMGLIFTIFIKSRKIPLFMATLKIKINGLLVY